MLPISDYHVLYYTVRDRKSNRQCISRAVSHDGPAGPFVDNSTRPLICQVRLGGSIDPDAFVDGGKIYLHWKRDDNAIGGITKLWGSQLSRDGLGLTGKTYQFMTYDQPWEKPLIEAPQMVRVDFGYHLFYSGNWWDSADAAVGYGRCSSALSGCTKKTKTGPWLAKDTFRVGTAGETFFKKDGQWFLAYHAWSPDKVGYPGGQRSLWINTKSFTSDDPVLGK